MRDYVAEAELIEAEYAADRMMMMRRSNPHHHTVQVLEQQINRLLRRRVGRAWHYTRLTDDEADRIRAEGMGSASIPAFEGRLARQVSLGSLTQAQAEVLFEQSALRGGQHEHQGGQICTTAVPFPVLDDGIENVLGLWGGETAAFHLQDQDLRTHLAGMGAPRVLELGVPLGSVRPASGLGHAAIAFYAYAAGVGWDPTLPDLFVIAPLGPDTVLSVHTQGEATFSALGSTYPAGLKGTLAERVSRGSWQAKERITNPKGSRSGDPHPRGL